MKSLALIASIVTLGLALPCQAGLVISLGGLQQTDPLSPTIANNSIVLTFDQIAFGQVQVTIDAHADAIKVKDILFNVDRAVTFGSATGVVPASRAYSSNGFGLGGPLTGFDVDVTYAVSGANGDFFAGKQTKFDIFAVGLTEQSFNVSNTNGFLGGVHINLPLGVSPSGKYGNTILGGLVIGVVPEPASICSWLGLGTIFGCAAYRRRRATA